MNTIKDVLIEIIELKGHDVLAKNDLVLSMFGDLAPKMTVEKIQLQTIMNAKAWQILLQGREQEEKFQVKAVNRARNILLAVGVQETIIDVLIGEITEALEYRCNSKECVSLPVEKGQSILTIQRTNKDELVDTINPNNLMKLFEQNVVAWATFSKVKENGLHYLLEYFNEPNNCIMKGVEGENLFTLLSDYFFLSLDALQMIKCNYDASKQKWANISIYEIEQKYLNEIWAELITLRLTNEQEFLNKVFQIKRELLSFGLSNNNVDRLLGIFVDAVHPSKRIKRNIKRWDY